MTNPTTPFSWQMPTATDLVTDLPADFEVFGQAVATSMADLLGGTTGQVLSKASNTDMDFTWVTTDDANAIQNTIVDAKGDLIGATAADTPARLAVGTNGQVLTADSTAATGLKWATPASGTTFAGAQASFSASGQTVSYTQNTNLILSFNFENYDTDGYHNTGSNQSRMTVPTGKGGYYLLAANGIFLGTVPGVSRIILYKNGTQYGEALSYGGRIGDTAGNNNLSLIGSAVVAGAAGDYFEIAYQGDLSTGSKTAYGSFTIAYLGA
jgi:hypothetical protein